MAETDHPLLVFPQSTRIERLRRRAFDSRIRVPDHDQQAERLVPQFQRLQEAMEGKRLALQDNTLGIQPEQVLVLETVGSIDKFINAVKRVDGLEWLGEFEHEIDPGYGFEDEKDSQKQLNGQLFLVMTDQQALQQMQNFFAQWRKTPDAPFPYGFAKLKEAFAHLHTIRHWDAEDRIRETGVLEDWQDRLQSDQDVVPFEAELWFREDSTRRQQAESHLRSIIASLDGEVVQQGVIPEISYHGILGRIPSEKASEIISQQEVRLFECEGIMHLRPVGQCAISISEDTEETDTLQDEPQPEPPQGDPIVALFDGMPLTGHRLLDRRLIVDDPDGYESDYQANERVHGTAMASLICHGDLSEKENEAVGKRLYARPIMKPRLRFDGQFEEAIPSDVLPIDLVHRAVRRLYETENGEPPVAPSIRVINLSIGDPARPLGREMSSWARLLDWLSWKYQILFIVSAGNHFHDLELDVPRSALHNLTAEERERDVVKAVATDTRNRRLLSPAETLNGLTIGAIHADSSSPSSYLIDPFVQTGLPSVISAHGPGYRRAVKPDLLLPGGRQFLDEKQGTTHSNAILQTNLYSRPPGQCVATPGSAGLLDQTVHTRGTSNAAALASRGASFLYDLIDQLRQQPDTVIPEDFDVVLIKALLVHGADWADARSCYEAALKNTQNSYTFREYLGRFLGYGQADLPKVMACTEQRVTVMGFGEFDDGEGDEFVLPLPPSLSAVRDRRRLTITLAWLSPVSSTRQTYRVAHLWFNAKNEIASQRVCADHRAVQRGTVQHEVFEGDSVVAFQDEDTIAIKVNCRADAGDISAPIRYGLAVTLEVAEGIDIPIYQEVRDRLAIRVPVQDARSI